MGKPKHYWYGIVKRMIISSSKHDREESLQQYIIAVAIENANKETLNLPDGEDRLKAVNIVLIQHRKNFYGAAQELNYSPRTIQRWVNSYINLVGRKAGY